jgi:hypothetical protein
MLHEFAATHRHPDRGRTSTTPRKSDSARSGSVIVDDTKGRFFAPAAGRNFLVGVSVNARF